MLIFCEKKSQNWNLGFILVILISGAEHFSECLALISEHRLHTEALQLYHTGSTEFKVTFSLVTRLLSIF